MYLDVYLHVHYSLTVSCRVHYFDYKDIKLNVLILHVLHFTLQATAQLSDSRVRWSSGRGNLD